MESAESLFWADQIANEILTREKFKYMDKPIKKPKIYTVKTSASLSGVLHIGRLVDTIRSESVYKALKDGKKKTMLIWVAEDMDPLRKIPKGVPEGYEKYLGMPVTDIPDWLGCHKSYAEHHISEYFKVLDMFVSSKMTKYSMRKEYKKGSFKPYIKKILENLDRVIEIQNRYRTNPLKPGWSPWTPICENCGKIITPRILGFDGGLVKYQCEDYSFEKTKALGCGHKGENNPLEGQGKLMWKSEWASQWAYWGVVSEGAGKEYQVPLSAWWVNAEIVERVLDFPMPVPIFYEHLMIDGEKMSASKGNIIYPKDWLQVANPEVLRFFYNKKIMKTRSFSWTDLPKLYDDYDLYEKVYFGEEKINNAREEKHMKRLFEISQIRKPKNAKQIPYDFAAMIGQVTTDGEKILEILKRTGHIKDKPSPYDLKKTEERIALARNWAKSYAPKQYKIEVQETLSKTTIDRLTEKQKKAIKMLAERLKESNEKELTDFFYSICKEAGIENKDFFAGIYLVLLGNESGPRLSRLILTIGIKKAKKLFSEIY